MSSMSFSAALAEYARTAPIVTAVSEPPTSSHATRCLALSGGAAEPEPAAAPEPTAGMLADPDPDPDPDPVSPTALPDPTPDPDPDPASLTSPPHATMCWRVSAMKFSVGFASFRYRRK